MPNSAYLPAREERSRHQSSKSCMLLFSLWLSPDVLFLRRTEGRCLLMLNYPLDCTACTFLFDLTNQQLENVEEYKKREKPACEEFLITCPPRIIVGGVFLISPFFAPFSWRHVAYLSHVPPWSIERNLFLSIRYFMTEWLTFIVSCILMLEDDNYYYRCPIRFAMIDLTN